MYGIPVVKNMDVFVQDNFYLRFGIEAGIKLKTVMADIPLNDCIAYIYVCTTD